MNYIHHCLLLVAFVSSETITRDVTYDHSPVVCSSFPCNIHCVMISSCSVTNISCPITGSGVCSIYLIGESAANASTIYGGASSNIIVIASGRYSFHSGTIIGNTVIGSKLNLNVYGDDAFQYATIYTPYGRDSEFVMICGDLDNHDLCCASMNIYDDYSTTVSLSSYSSRGFQQTVISPQINIVKSVDPGNPNYINYRGSVNIYSSTLNNGFQEFIYYGTDHGNWTILGEGSNAFLSAIIHADHSFVTIDQYFIIVTGQTESNVMQLTLYASQNNATIVLTAYSNNAFYPNFRLICNRKEMFLNRLEMTSYGRYGFRFSVFNITSNINDLVLVANGVGGYSWQNMNLTIDAIWNNALFIINNNGDNYGYQSFLNARIIIHRIVGNIHFIDNGYDASGFESSYIQIVGGIGGNVLFLANTTTNGRSFRNSVVKLGNILGTLEVSDYSVYGESFMPFDITTGTVYGEYVLFQSVYDTNRQSFDASTITIGGVPNGYLSLLSNSLGSFSECSFIVNNTIGGNVTLIDTSLGGYGFYNGYFYFLGNISGNVLLKDNQTGSNGGRVFISTDFIFRNIYGTFKVIEDSLYGSSFTGTTFQIANIYGETIIQSVYDNNRYAFDNSIFSINAIGSDLSLLANTFHSFDDCSFTVNNGVNGNIIMIDSSLNGFGFYSADFIFNGTINGNVLIKDMSTGGNGGRSAQTTLFKFDYINGSIQVIEDNIYGSSFFQTDFQINYINGNALWAALVDNNRQAFDQAKWNIGVINGDLTMYANTVQAFSDQYINIYQINGIGSFIANSSTQQVFYNTDFNITKATKLIFDAYSSAGGDFRIANFFVHECDEIIFNIHSESGQNALYDTNHYYGNISLVQINIDTTSPNSLYHTMIDCRYCDKFILNCNENANCGNTVDIYCPQDVDDINCLINCGVNSDCNDIDLFTNKGYCKDALFICLDQTNVSNTCNMVSSQIFCTLNTTDVYGTASTSYCSMTQTNNQWNCNENLASSCARGCTLPPTMEPTISPSRYPSKSPTTVFPTTTMQPSSTPITIQPTLNPITVQPTIIPSELPTLVPITSNPTPNPTTLDPTSYPTLYPTTKSPTDGDQQIDTTANSVTVETITKDEDNVQSDDNIININLIIYIILGSIIICLICILIFYCQYNKRKNGKTGKQGIEIMHITSESFKYPPINQIQSDTDNYNNYPNQGVVNPMGVSKIDTTHAVHDAAASMKDDIVLGNDEMNFLANGITPFGADDEKESDPLESDDVTQEDDDIVDELDDDYVMNAMQTAQ